MGTEQATFMDVIKGDSRPHRPTYDTFRASQLGYCARQLYLSQLGLRRIAEGRGRLDASRLVQEHLEEQVAEQCPNIEVSPQMTLTVDGLCFVGTPTAYNPTTETVYHIKPRNGWYKFHPPVKRHLDQLQVYMHGLGATKGRFIYVSMGDLTDTRTWPPDDREYVERDTQRFQRVVARARTVRDEIVANGVAQSTNDIPFDHCGGFLCDSEALVLDSAFTDETDANSDPETNAGTDEDTASTVERHTGSDCQLADVETQPLATDRYHVPSELKVEDFWVVWDTESKIARAPWETGTMYPVQWAESGDVDPRHEFEKAEMVADLPVERVHESWPFPSGEQLPEAVAPAILLKHAGDTDVEPITLVDFDNVRDPETMATSQEVIDLVKDLGGYAEVSRSGTGLHVFVKGGLAQGMETFYGPLHDAGHVEIYDHSRFVATTFNHVEDTPPDEIPYAGEVLSDLVNHYSHE